MRTKVTITDPAVMKELKVQKDGSVYLSKDLAGERVNIVAEAADVTTNVPREDVDAAIGELLQSLNTADSEERSHLIQSALRTLHHDR